jgi:hypothetical protein
LEESIAKLVKLFLKCEPVSCMDIKNYDFPWSSLHFLVCQKEIINYYEEQRKCWTKPKIITNFMLKNFSDFKFSHTCSMKMCWVTLSDWW